MKTVEKTFVLREVLDTVSGQGKTIGFVPTMGALHQGHMSLLKKAKQENDVVVCSIFVNPIQFNKEEDLAKYPRTLPDDLRKLEEAGCDFAFTPSNEEMYPEPVREKYDFGRLETVMEGRYRPGHFNGVAVVVRKLLDMVKPDRAYFGEKDFQQLQIIRRLVQMTKLEVQIVPVAISRKEDGLARSSRNTRLKPEERKVAPEIYRIIREAKDKIIDFDTPGQMKHWGWKELKNTHLLEPEYVEVVDMDTLEPVEQWSQTDRCILCVAVFLGKVRLIDNIILFL